MPRMLPVLLALGVLAVGCGGEDDADELPPHTTIGADFIPDVTDADVERIVRRDYTDTQLEDVGQVLAAYGTENCEPDGNARGRARVRLAALKLAAELPINERKSRQPPFRRND